MGWTGYQPTHFKKGGIVDRKAECDAYFMEGLNRGNFQVLKSSIKGSVYYAAVKDMVRYAGEDEKEHSIYVPIDDGKVRGYVFLTSVKDGMFYYKDISEDMGPGYYDCPESILKLSKLPIGTKIIWTRKDGVEVELLKHAPAYQFKRPFWFNAADRTYMSAKWIVDWEVKED